MRLQWLRRLRIGGLLFVSSCDHCGSSQQAIPAPASAAAPQTAAPAGLVAEVVVGDPASLWTTLRASSPRLSGTPTQYPLMLARALGASPLLSGRFIPSAPLVGAIGAPIDTGSENGEAAASVSGAWVVGFRVHSGGELAAELSSGHTAPFQAQRSNGIVLLQGRLTVAVANNYLFFGSSPAALRRLAGFASTIDVSEVARARDGARLKLASGAGAALASWLGLARASLSEQSRSSGADGMVTTFGAALLEFARGIAGGELRLAVIDGAVECAAELNAPLPLEVTTDVCAVLAEVPALAGAYVAVGDVPSLEAQLAGLLSAGESDRPRREVIDKVLSGLRGPWLVGLDTSRELSLFESHVQVGGEQELAQVSRALLKSSIAESWFPRQLGGARLIESSAPGGVFGGRLVAPGEATARAEFSWALRGSRAWTAFSPNARAWLAGHLGDLKTRLGAVPPCAPGTFLAANVPLADGLLDARLVKSPTGMQVSASLPLEAVLSYVRPGP